MTASTLLSSLQSSSKQSVLDSSPLLVLGDWLKRQNYEFVTPTPLTHTMINSRPENLEGKSSRDVFGWSRAFQKDVLPDDLFQQLLDSDWIYAVDEESQPTLFKSRVRCSTLFGELFFHSAFPTVEADSVFFGPDTYRFASLIESQIEKREWQGKLRVLEVCCGAGPGGIVASKLFGRIKSVSAELVLSDINTRALDLSSVNAKIADLSNSEIVQSDLYARLEGRFDLIVANPPYLVDAKSRVYRDGGGVMGTGLGIRIVKEGLDLLDDDGILVLYTGVPIIDGNDSFRSQMLRIAQTEGVELEYREIDPDVFSEELLSEAYATTDRIAVVSAVFQNSSKISQRR